MCVKYTLKLGKKIVGRVQLQRYIKYKGEGKIEGLENVERMRSKTQEELSQKDRQSSSTDMGGIKYGMKQV